MLSISYSDNYISIVFQIQVLQSNNFSTKIKMIRL